MKNPFLDDGFAIAWSELVPDKVRPDISRALEEAQKKINAIGSGIALTFENTFLALEDATEALSVAWQKVSHLDSVDNSSELREAYNEMLPKVTEFWAKIPLNEALWAVLKAYAEAEEAHDLNAVKRRYLEETMADFREHGADLPEEKKERFEAVSRELAQLTQKFSENVLDSSNQFEIILKDEEKLEGLPELAKEQARQDALRKGYGSEEKPCWRFTQQVPSYFPAMKYLKDENIRKTLWEGSNTIGYAEPFDNTNLIWKILALREEKARTLNLPGFADLVLKRRMAKDGKNAMAFVEELFTRVKEAFDRECSDLENFKAERTSGVSEPLEPWEMAFWAENLRRERYDFDEEELRPFFSIDPVIEGMFRIAERLFGIQICERSAVCLKADEIDPSEDRDSKPSASIEVWHPEVKYYEVRGREGALLGAFYTDWHPRESKRSGAWMNSLITGGPAGEKEGPGQWKPHVGLICGNLTPSVDGKPSLLTHDEVQTIFHEFGHLLHHLLGEVEIKSLNGIHVAWDFVELPSQIMENWCWERESLDFFARHYESGAPIPETLFEKMMKARNFHSAMMMMRQLSFGKMDLELHCRYPEYEGGDLDRLLDMMLVDFHPPSKTKPLPIIRRFSHLFASSTGYAAGYYSYKWAEVLDADAFTRFKREGILNAEVGREFREKILSKGNSEEPAQLFRDFMGRDPNTSALLARSGLA